MIRWPCLLVLAVMAGACDRPLSRTGGAPVEPPDLETAAIAAGVIADPATGDLTGLFARDTDRVCIVPDQRGFAIGIFVDYGDGQSCSGRGTVTRTGETLHIALSDAGECGFDARFEGDRIVLPGRLPAACARVCNRRASMAALDVRRMSDSASEASTLRDSRGRLLCRAGQ